MSVVSRAYLKTKFVSGAKPTQQDYTDFLDSVVFGTSAQVSAGDFGLQLMGTQTTSQAQNLLGSQVGVQLLSVPTTADAQNILGITQAQFSTVGAQIASAATTAAVQNILSNGFTLQQPTLVSASTNAITFGNSSLDYYNYTTFTPTVIGSSTAGVGTYGTQQAYYTRVGNRVFFEIYLSWTAHTGTGNIQIAGLPFTPTSYSALSVYYSGLTTAAGAQLCAYTNSGTNNIVLYYCSNGAASTPVPMDTLVNELMIAGSYKV